MLLLSLPFSYWKVQRDSRVFVWFGDLSLLNRDLTLRHPLPPKCLEWIQKQITTINKATMTFFIAGSALNSIVLKFHFFFHKTFMFATRSLSFLTTSYQQKIHFLNLYLGILGNVRCSDWSFSLMQCITMIEAWTRGLLLNTITWNKGRKHLIDTISI